MTLDAVTAGADWGREAAPCTSQITECKEGLRRSGAGFVWTAAAVRLVVLSRVARLSQLTLCVNLLLLAVKEKYYIGSFVHVPYHGRLFFLMRLSLLQAF